MQIQKTPPLLKIGKSLPVHETKLIPLQYAWESELS